MQKRTTSSLSPTAARYYIQRLGTMQGEMAYTEQPTDVTTEAMTIAGITVYVKKTVVNNLSASGIPPRPPSAGRAQRPAVAILNEYA